ncbi:MAG: cupin domain-containing protein [Chloroflexota bacterium]|nr:cupin domain-containing protein [Chloroflexota bacterium]
MTASGSGQGGTDVVDLVSLAVCEGNRIVWARQTEDLNVNLVTLDAGSETSAHINSEVDVLVVGVKGEGEVDVDAASHPLRPGQVIVIPRGTRRAMRSSGGCFAYLTCHRRRAGLWPERAPRHGVRQQAS